MKFNKALSALIFSLTFSSCSLSAEEVVDKSAQFRAHLVEAMKQDGFSESEIAYRALYTPSDFRKSVFTMEESTSKYSPIDLYGAQIAPKEVNEEAFSLSVKKPKILVIFPGIASDLIDAFVFESALKTKAEKVSLKLSSEQKDRVSLSKYTDTVGNNLLYIVDLRSPSLKMESFLPPKQLGQIFKKSIDEVFSAAGFDSSEESVYFLGYSRGVLPALSILDEANKSSNPPSWYKTKSGKDRLKGLISMSGSLNGSFADSLYEKDDVLVKGGEDLAKKLDLLDPSIDAFEENYNLFLQPYGNFEDSILSMTLTLLGELQEVLPIDPTMSINLDPSKGGVLQIPNLTDERIKAESGNRRLDNFIGHNIADLTGIVQKLTKDLVFLDAIHRYPDCDASCKTLYADSINNLKSLKHVIPGLIMMQEDRLVNFWSKLNLPNHVNYYSLSATMPEPHNSFTEANIPEYKDAYTTFSNNIDSLALRISYYAYADNLGHTLNDGQVAAAHSMFRHDYLSMGSGKKYKLVDLGIIGATHWEVALNPAFVTPKEWQEDMEQKPHFHSSVLQAIANTIIMED